MINLVILIGIITLVIIESTRLKTLIKVDKGSYVNNEVVRMQVSSKLFGNDTLKDASESIEFIVNDSVDLFIKNELLNGISVKRYITNPASDITDLKVRLSNKDREEDVAKILNKVMNRISNYSIDRLAKFINRNDIQTYIEEMVRENYVLIVDIISDLKLNRKANRVPKLSKIEKEINDNILKTIKQKEKDVSIIGKKLSNIKSTRNLSTRNQSIIELLNSTLESTQTEIVNLKNNLIKHK